MLVQERKLFPPSKIQRNNISHSSQWGELYASRIKGKGTISPIWIIMEMALLIENKEKRKVEKIEKYRKKKVSNYNKIKFALKFSSITNKYFFIYRKNWYICASVASNLLLVEILHFSWKSKRKEVMEKVRPLIFSKVRSDLYKNYISVEFQNSFSSSRKSSKGVFVYYVKT